jgi:hypothetical protein
MLEDESWKESEEIFFEVINEITTESQKENVERNQFFL